MQDFYIKNPQSKLALLKNSINQTSEIMHENVEKLFQRNEKLEITLQKSNNLLGNSDVFYKNIHRMKMKQKYKRLKYIGEYGYKTDNKGDRLRLYNIINGRT